MKEAREHIKSSYSTTKSTPPAPDYCIRAVYLQYIQCHKHILVFKHWQEMVFFRRLRSPEIDSKESIPPAYVARAGICSRVKGWKIDSWNRLGNKYGIEVPMSHVHVKINFSYGIDSRNRCLSVHKLLQIRAPAGRYHNPILTGFLARHRLF